MQIKTDNPGTSNSNQFTLPLYPGSSYDFTIDWGDGTPAESTTSWSSLTHTYATVSTYTISITENTPTGGFSRINFSNTGDRLKLLGISQWGDVHWTTLSAAFWGCENLVITATDHATANTGAVLDFTYAWNNCRSLTSFPLIKTTAGVSFSGAWLGCSGLTSFPAINTANGINFRDAWSGCSGLTGFPSINTANGTNFSNSWSGCSGMTSFPSITTVNGTNFSSSWFNCSGLTSFPAINTTNGTKFHSTWRGCSGLTSFPAINTANGTNFQFTWAGCSGLTSFPAINTANGTTFLGAWSQCNGLASFPAINTAKGTEFAYAWEECIGLTAFPVLDLSSMITGTECFNNVRLPTATYSALLTDLATRNANPNVTFDGGYSRHTLSAASARTTLTGTRSWTITDGGLASPIITSPPIASVLQGTAFTYTITASENPTSFDALYLPSPLGHSNGIISGLAPSSTGTHWVTISATNAEGTGNRTLLLYVNAAGAPTITSATTAGGVRGQAFPTYQITATGSPTSWAAIDLPSGLSCSSTGAITGTPTMVGTTLVSVQATNGNGTGVATLTVTIASPGGSGGGGSGGGGGGGGGGCGVGSVSAMLLAMLACLGFRRRSYCRQ